MPAFNPHRFLLRGSALLVGLLVLWWFALRNPLLFLLKESVNVCGAVVLGGPSTALITDAPNGDWTFEVPLEFSVPAAPQQPGPVHMRSIDFDLARPDAGSFTFGLPVYWAIILAAPGIRRSLRPLIQGTLVMACGEIVLVLIFAEIFARKTAAQLTQSQDALSNGLLHFGDYLVMGVIPYVVPFMIAIWLHRELRDQIFQWSGTTTVPAEGAANSAGNPRRQPNKRSRNRE
jgi:hypothetical protein